MWSRDRSFTLLILKLDDPKFRLYYLRYLVNKNFGIWIDYVHYYQISEFEIPFYHEDYDF